MKLAFVHIVRTGGTYTLDQLAACGLTPRCPWRARLNRDFNRQELLNALRAPASNTVVHGHVVAWDAETVRYAKAHGWRTFTIVREPCEQLTSLYRYITDWKEKPPIHNWLIAQAQGDWWHTDHNVWAVPEYWAELEILRHEKPLWPVLKTLGIDGPAVSACNGSPPGPEPSAESLAAVRSSRFYERYLRATNNRDNGFTVLARS